MYIVLNLTKDHDAGQNGFMSSNIGHQEDDFDVICKLASKYDFDGVNVDMQNNKYTIVEMNNLLREYDLTPVSFHCAVNFSGSEDAFAASLEQFEIQAKNACAIGCGLALKYLPPFSNHLNFNNHFKLYSTRLEKIKPILLEYNLKIAFEFIGPAQTRLNSKYDFVHTIDGVRSLISSSNTYGYIGFKLDIHHWQHSGATVLDLMHLDKEYILYVELNDGLQGYNSFYMPEFIRTLPLETGVNDVKGFLNAIYKNGYRGPVAVEPWSPYIASLDIEKAIELSKLSLNKCFQLIEKENPQ
jgi:sugar phosphate isomerase/epimerase